MSDVETDWDPEVTEAERLQQQRDSAKGIRANERERLVEALRELHPPTDWNDARGEADWQHGVDAAIKTIEEKETE